MTEEKRFRFVQDDSCNWYAIPVGDLLGFRIWEESFNDGPEYFGTDYDAYRLNTAISNYTFADLREGF